MGTSMKHKRFLIHSRFVTQSTKFSISVDGHYLYHRHNSQSTIIDDKIYVSMYYKCYRCLGNLFSTISTQVHLV